MFFALPLSISASFLLSIKEKSVPLYPKCAQVNLIGFAVAISDVTMSSMLDCLFCGGK